RHCTRSLTVAARQQTTPIAMLELKLHPLELPLRHAWTIAHGTRTVQRNLVVELHDPETGLSGYGEAAAIPYFDVHLEQLTGFLHLQRKWIEASESEQFRAMFENLHSQHEWSTQRFGFCAIDQAFQDLEGKRVGKANWKRCDLHLSTCPQSDYTIGMAEPDVMADKLNEFPNFPVYKIKLGTGSPETDLKLVERLRKETEATFRVDANCAWTAEEAITISGPLKQLGVEFIEQPLKCEAAQEEHEAVYFGSDLPIMADESCITESDVDACAGVFHGVNIKLMKCGGMTPARRMIARAREHGMKVMIGCMTETTVGISAIGQLLPLLDYVDMDGALLLAKDVADGVKVGDDGVAVFPDTPGNGVTWHGLT
ncbi:MAG: dipeptide epimerase, partial [Planctomycetota bacterium]